MKHNISKWERGNKSVKILESVMYSCLPMENLMVNFYSKSQSNKLDGWRDNMDWNKKITNWQLANVQVEMRQ